MKKGYRPKGPETSKNLIPPNVGSSIKQGYDITKVEIQQIDEERENMKALSKEELKAIAYANMNKKEKE